MMSENDEKKRAGDADSDLPEHLKELVGSLQTQQRALFVAAVSLLILRLAPPPDVLQRAAAGEVSGIIQSQAFAQVGEAVRQQGEQGGEAQRFWAGIADAPFFDLVAPRKFDVESRKAIGFNEPVTLGDYARLVDAEAHTCVPVVDERVLAGFLSLLDAPCTDVGGGKGAKPFRVTQVKLRAVADGETLDAVRALSRAAWLADEKRLAIPKVLQRGEESEIVLPREPPKEVYQVTPGGRTIVVDNSEALRRWREIKDRIENQRGAAKKHELAMNEAGAAVREAGKSLRVAADEVDRLLAAHPAVARGTQQYVVAVLNIEKRKDIDGRDIHKIMLPCSCANEPLRLEKSPSALNTSRLIPEWDTIQRLPPGSAASVLEASINNNDQSVEVGGLKLTERQLNELGPTIIASLLLWQAWLLRRLRIAIKVTRIQDALAKTRGLLLPHSKNLGVVFLALVPPLALVFALGWGKLLSSARVAAPVTLCFVFAAYVLYQSSRTVLSDSGKQSPDKPSTG